MSIIIFVKSIPWVVKGVITGNLSKFVVRGKEFTYIDIYAALLLITIAIVIIVGFAFIFTSFGISLTDSVFALTSALSNTGLYAGIINNSLPMLLKLILILVMIVGRIGIITLLVAMTPKPAGSIPLKPDTARPDNVP